MRDGFRKAFTRRRRIIVEIGGTPATLLWIDQRQSKNATPGTAWKPRDQLRGLPRSEGWALPEQHCLPGLRRVWRQ